jgi:hypothetical protein
MLALRAYKKLNHPSMILTGEISILDLLIIVYQYTQNWMAWYTCELKKVYL